MYHSEKYNKESGALELENRTCEFIIIAPHKDMWVRILINNMNGKSEYDYL